MPDFPPIVVKSTILEEFAIGTLTANGTEQTVAESTALCTIEGHIDLSNMQVGDSITIREYIKHKSGGTYRLYDSAEYSDVQTKPCLHVSKLPSKYGAKITLQQTSGTYRAFDYDFFREVLA